MLCLRFSTQNEEREACSISSGSHKSLHHIRNVSLILRSRKKQLKDQPFWPFLAKPYGDQWNAGILPKIFIDKSGMLCPKIFTQNIFWIILYLYILQFFQMVSFKSMKKSQELSQWVCDDDRVSNQSLQKCNFIYIFFFLK